MNPRCVSGTPRNGTLRRLHNAVALGLIDIDRVRGTLGTGVGGAALHLDALVGDLPGPGASSPLLPTGSNCAGCSAHSSAGVDRADAAGPAPADGFCGLDLTRAFASR
jgi:hypothetical protein